MLNISTLIVLPKKHFYEPLHTTTTTVVNNSEG